MLFTWWMDTPINAHVYTMEYYSTIRKNKLFIKRITFQCIMPSESWSEKAPFRFTPFIFHSAKSKQISVCQDLG